MRKVSPQELLYSIQVYEKEKQMGVYYPKVSKKALKKFLKSYFGDEQQITILNLDTYKEIVQEDCERMEKERLTKQKYRNIGKMEVLEAYELWLQYALIDKDFENSWLSLMGGKSTDPSFEKLEMIFTKANDIRMKENAGYELSAGQQIMLDNFYRCFPVIKPKLLTIVKQFFTRFHIYYQNEGLDDTSLTSFQKLQLASHWLIEQKLEGTVRTTKGDVVAAYNNWLGHIPYFEGSVDWAWSQLVKRSQPMKDYRLGFVPFNLKTIQSKADILFKENDFERLSNDDKAFVVSYWICFGENRDGFNMENAKQFFDTYAKYCRSEGLNPYAFSLDQIKTARTWRDEAVFEKGTAQERKRIKCT